MTVNFGGNVYDDAGNAVNGASVKLLETGTTTQEGSTVTTDSNGRWDFLEADQDRYDVEITKGSSVRRIKWSDEISLQELDVRNNTGAAYPAATFTNLTNSAANQVAVFSGANSTKADNDEIYLSFKMHDSAGNLDEFARMTVVATDVTSGTEDGQIEFDVIKAGTLTNVWTLTSSSGAAMSFDMNVDSLTFGAGADTDITLTFDANSADGVITWMEDEDYFKFSDDILMTSTEKLLFGDTGTYIYQSADGQLDLVADTEVQIAATTIDIDGAVAFDGALTGITNITLSGTLSDGNYTFDTSGNVSGLGTVGSGAITSTGTIQGTTITATTAFVPDASDGAALGTTSLEFSDLYLADEAVLGFGDDQDVTLTHVVDAGILLNSTMKIQFNDSSQFIHGSSATVLSIGATDKIDLTATALDLNGTLDVSGATVFQTSIDITGSAGIILENDETITNSTNGLISLSGNLAIANGGTIGSASDTDSITISSGGVVTMNQIPVFSAGINIDGGAIDGAVIGANSAAAGTFAAIVGTTIDASTDFTIGSTVITDDVITFTPTTSDTVVLTATTDGAFSLVTTDAGGAAANIQITADGTAELAGTTVTLDSSGDIALDASTAILGGALADTFTTFAFRSGRATAGNSHHAVSFQNDASGVIAQIAINGGDDDGNDDEGRMSLATAAPGGTMTNRIMMDEHGTVWIGNENSNQTNAQMDGVGLTISQVAANHQEILAFKNASTGHSYTSSAEADTFATFEMANVSSERGGLVITAYNEDVGNSSTMRLRTYGGTASDTKTTSGIGLFIIEVAELTDDAPGDIAANGNVFSVRARVGGSTLTRFLVDEDGDLFVVNVTGSAPDATAFDEYDDALLLRTFDTHRYAPGIIRTEFDNIVRNNESDLVDLGILGAPIDEGGLWNLTQHTRLLTGAAWQAAHDITSIAQAMSSEQRKLLTPRLQERLALMEAT